MEHFWQQSIDNDEFSKQVNWELEVLEKCDLIIMYFDANTKSTVSMLEFGLFSKSKKVAPKAFGETDTTFLNLIV